MYQTVYIIESPSAGDLLIGRNEGDALRRILFLGGIPAQYYMATSVDTFDDALQLIVEALKIDAENDECFQAHLHISAHGSVDGLELTDGDCLEWEAFSRRLRDAHETIGPVRFEDDLFPQNLPLMTVAFSSCSAFTNFKGSVENEQYYQSLIGPNADIDWCDALIAYAVYYRNSSHHAKNLEKSVNRMNYSIGGIENRIFEFDINKQTLEFRQTEKFREIAQNIKENKG